MNDSLDLKSVLDLHSKWLKEEPGGKWADLSRADLSDADLSGADLSKANLTRTNLSEADLSEACLFEANLYGADLSRADLSGAILTRANLTRADLYKANLFRAHLAETDLTRANLTRTNLFGANLIDIKGKEIWSFQIGKNFGFYVDGNITIGYELHSLEEWTEIGSSIMEDMNYSNREIELYMAQILLINNMVNK